MVGLSGDGLRFLDDMWDNFRKRLPDSVLGIFDNLRSDVFEHMAIGFGVAVERKSSWLKNDMLMILADLVSNKMSETKDKLVIRELKTIRDIAVKRVLEQLKNRL